MLFHSNEVKTITNNETNNSAMNSNLSVIESFPEYKYGIDSSIYSSSNIMKNELNFLITTSNLNLTFTNNFNLSTFQIIKNSFLSLFKIIYPDEFFKNVYEKKYRSIIGFEKSHKEIVCFSHIEVKKSTKSADILTFGVIKEYQNKRIGTRLIKKVIEELCMIGVKKVNLIVQETNEIAVRLYHKHGFRIDKVIDDYYPSLSGEEGRALQMTLEINPQKSWLSEVLDKLKNCF